MAYGDNRNEIASDAFTSSIDGNWENGGGDWVAFQWQPGGGGHIDLTGTGNGGMRRNNETFADDQYSIITANEAIGASQWFAAHCRMAAGTDETAYVGYSEFDGTGEFRLFKVDSAFSFTEIGTGTSTGWANLVQGDTLTLEVEGTTLRLGDDRGTDTQRLTETDATISSGDPGLGGFGTGAGVLNYTAWSGGDIAAAGINTIIIVPTGPPLS